jgi:hypothetical protein
MLKKNIKITNAFGQEETKICYFNLTRMEVLELQKRYKEGYEEHVKNIIDSKDTTSIMGVFTELVLSSYCHVDDNGTIIKNKEIRDAFEHSEEFSELMFELLNTDDQKKAQEFLVAIMPKQVQGQIKEELNKQNNNIKSITEATTIETK